MKIFVKKTRGYILLLSILIVSIILAISFGIHAIGLKEVVLASFLRDSAKAFAAADNAAECALYWDQSSPRNGIAYTIFATSSDHQAPTNLASARCQGQQLSQTPVTGWVVSNLTPTTASTDFSLAFSDGTCASVTVRKTAIGTSVLSNGHNDCRPTNTRRTQRTIEVSTNL